MSKTELDPTKFSTGPVPIQTGEDALMAYLREEISEEEFREACNRYGVLPGTLSVDTSAYKRDIPDDLKAPVVETPTVEERMKTAEEKAAEREKATKEDHQASKASANEKTAPPVGEKQTGSMGEKK